MPILIHSLSVSKMNDFMKAYSLSQRISSAVWFIAGISNPNLGLNGVTGMIGVSFFF